MSQLRVTETCCCGARHEDTGYMVYVIEEIDKFRAAHAICRERLTQPIPFYGLEEQAGGVA